MSSDLKNKKTKQKKHFYNFRQKSLKAFYMPKKDDVIKVNNKSFYPFPKVAN